MSGVTYELSMHNKLQGAKSVFAFKVSFRQSV